MILIAGATGLVGGEVVRRLRAAGKPVHALVRARASAEKRAAIESTGATIVEGDLKDPASLARACEGVETVISTASAMLSRGEGDTIDSVDRDGQLNLVAAAKGATVEHFIYLSFSGNVDERFPLRDAKRTVEHRLAQSGMPYTIVRPSFFMEVWLSPAVGFDVAGGRVRVFGTGDRPISFISAFDVAEYVVGCAGNPAVRNQTIELGGPEALTINNVIEMFERATRRTIARDHIPEAVLDQQLRAATDPMEKTMAGLALAVARGDAIDVKPALAKAPIALTWVADFVSQMTQPR